MKNFARIVIASKYRNTLVTASRTPGVSRLLPLKARRVNTLGFVDRTVSVGTTELCHCRVKRARDKAEEKECVCVNKTLFIRLGSAGGGGMRSSCLMGTESQLEVLEELWRWGVMPVAQEFECPNAPE